MTIVFYQNPRRNMRLVDAFMGGIKPYRFLRKGHWMKLRLSTMTRIEIWVRNCTILPWETIIKEEFYG